MNQMTVKKPSARKSLRLFTNIFDVGNRTAIRRIGNEKLKRRSIKSGCGLWTNKIKQKVHKKNNEQIKYNIYT